MTNKTNKTKTATNQHEYASNTGVPETQKGSNEERLPIVRPTGDISLRTRFTKEMATRSIEDGVHPIEFLYSIVSNPDLEFTDWIAHRGQLIKVERTATLAERVDCARTILPYVEAKKVTVEHSGQIQVLHALAESALDSVTLDSEGRVIEDATEAEFEDLE